jgi:hypothetical protein
MTTPTGASPSVEFSLSAVSCPQCGAAVALPHDSESVVCPACGSGLRMVGGVLVQVVMERIELTRAQAEDSLRAWISRGAAPMAARNRSDQGAPWTAVGDLRFYPFLKVSGASGERVTPLAPLSSPWVAELGHAPGQLLDASTPGLPPGAPAAVTAAMLAPAVAAAPTVAPMAVASALTAAPTAAPTVTASVSAGTTLPDPALVKAALGTAMADRSVSRVLIEYRGYYPAKYSLEGNDGQRRDAIVAAGQGVVYGEQPPSRRPSARDQGVFLGETALLLAEAAFAPGLLPRLIAVLMTALVAFVLLGLTVVQDG